MAEAIVSEPNNTIRFAADVPPTGVTVQRGPHAGRPGRPTTARRSSSPSSSRSTSPQVLRDAQADVVVSYLPVGSEQAARYYAQAAIDAGVGFVNCLPVFIASDGRVGEEVRRRRACRSSATTSRARSARRSRTASSTKLFEDRGVKLNRTYQLNFGGNMDFMNMLERERLTSKKISKTQSVQSQLRRELDKNNIHIGPSDYVPWLEDRKWAQIRLEGQSFGDVPLIIELKLEVWDSPNSAGIVIDAVRCVKLAHRPQASPVR